MVGLCYDIGCLDDIVLAEVARVSALNSGGSSDSKSASNVMKMISKGLRPPLPAYVKPCVKQMIEQCWQNDPDLRPSSTQLYNLITHVIRPTLKDDLKEGELNVTMTLKEVEKTQATFRKMSVMGTPALNADGSVIINKLNSIDKPITHWKNIILCNVKFSTIVLVISNNVTMTKFSTAYFNAES